MSDLRIGSLFTGYGGLDLGLQAVLGGRIAWHADIDPGPCRLLAHRWPEVPNLGDVSAIDFRDVEPVDVLTGGFPCQDVSAAGRRAGLGPGTRTGLWAEMHRAIQAIRPALVVAENVRGLLSAEAHTARDVEPDPWDLGDRRGRPALRALGAVLGDLAGIGYDARWYGLRAADAGAPHGRFRVFVFAWPAADASSERRGWSWSPWDRRLGPADDDLPAADTEGDGFGRGGFGQVGGSTSAREGQAWQRERHRPAPGSRDRSTTNWGAYAPAITRWEFVTGRAAPAPTEPGKTGQPRLSPAFVEWLMGLPDGHVTAVPGLTRNQQLKLLGNGVVPQQAMLAAWWFLAERDAAA